MDVRTLQIIAGSFSTLLFIGGNIPMLVKAHRTHNLQSYSLSNLAITNGGNLVHWLYISQLPFGPIWLLHGFYTLTSIVMLAWYLRYERRGTAEQQKGRGDVRALNKIEFWRSD